VTTLAAPLLLAALLPQSPGLDRERVATASDSVLIAEARTRPLAVRESVGQALARSVRDGGPEDLLLARRLATAYAVAWRDSFLLREVTRFVGWPADRRAGKVWADSVRRDAIATFSSDGATAALPAWRRALVVADGVADTAGMAAIFGNIGAALSVDGAMDSAEAYLGQARTLARAVGHVQVEANAVLLLGQGREARGELAAARALYARAVILHERIGDARGLAADYNSLGSLAQAVGDLEEARRQYEEAFAVNRREGRDELAATNLVNLAGLATLAGDFARADRLYRDALATWRAREDWAEAAYALHGLGLMELRRGDYPAARATLSEALAIYERTGPMDRALAVRRALAGALGAQGDVQGALDELRRALDLADSAGAPPDVRAGLTLSRADLAVRLNALPEAERLYAAAEVHYRAAANPGGQAEAQEGRALIQLERGDAADAQALLESALRHQLAAGNGRAAALMRLSLGRATLARGDTTAARDVLAEAAAELERLGDPVALAAAVGMQADLELGSRLPAAAEQLYRDALARLGDRAVPDVAWRLRAGLARARRVQGATDDAVRELRAAVVELERPAGSLVLAERRSAFLADKWDVFVELALVERGRGRLGGAFEASERLRAREMMELLDRGRVEPPSNTSAAVVAREQDLRRRIGDLSRRLERADGAAEALRGPDVSLTSDVTREALLGAQQAYAELLLEMRERAPRHAALVSPKPPEWREAARRLAADEAIVEYLLSDSASLAFVITSDTIGAVDLGIDRRELARLVEFVRGTLERHAVGSDPLWRAPLRRLHTHLIAPLEEKGLLRGRARLVLVPHAELHYLPFAALIGGDRGERFLTERYELAVTPSVSVWLSLGDRPAPAGNGILAVVPRPQQLPASRLEVAAIEQRGGADVRVLAGRAATEEAFRREAAGRRVLHLATYGVFNKPNPLFSYVELAPGPEQDGRLEVHEVFGLDLVADLVVLSACQTGLGSGALADVPAGDDWVGLTRAFLHAGAARVVASLWAVEDQATGELMSRFYEALAAGVRPAWALSLAQRALLVQPGTAHPFYWAGFVAVEGSPPAGASSGTQGSR
jgi:CHAT domain-containing protein/Tfp pilus assembly protein PilF